MLVDKVAQCRQTDVAQQLQPVKAEPLLGSGQGWLRTATPLASWSGLCCCWETATRPCEEPPAVCSQAELRAAECCWW